MAAPPPTDPKLPARQVPRPKTGVAKSSSSVSSSKELCYTNSVSADVAYRFLKRLYGRIPEIGASGLKSGDGEWDGPTGRRPPPPSTLPAHSRRSDKRPTDK